METYIPVNIFSRYNGITFGFSADRDICYMSRDFRDFRPIKSEREKVIDAAVAVMQETDSSSTFTDIAEALYKAGMLRVKPDA
jgi:hypothetical protein